MDLKKKSCASYAAFFAMAYLMSLVYVMPMAVKKNNRKSRTRIINPYMF